MTQTVIPTKQLPVVTTVGDPGSDNAIPTEQAVREAFLTITSPTLIVSASTKLYIYELFR
jgi:hypothetical protein